MTYTLELTLRSDATFGRGDGVAGLVDTEVEHDPDTGLPRLRGRTLKGLLVEECDHIFYALGLHGTPPATLTHAAAFLFGRPGSGSGTQAHLHVGTARLHPALADALRADIAHGDLTPPDVLEALTAIRHQTAIEDVTGRPAEGSLRAIRVVQRGLTLSAPLHLDAPPPPAAEALLYACVRSLRRAGTSRNRGRGRVQARLLHPDGREVNHADTLPQFVPAA